MIDVDPSLKKGRRWVNKEINRLDPDKDYVRIMALVAEYQQDEVILHMLITNTNIHVVKPGHWKDNLSFNDQLPYKPYIRAQDSLDFFWTWFSKGADYIDKIDSINRADKNNQSSIDHLPGFFKRSPDYIYTFCLLATGQNRILKRLGLAEIDDTIKRASYNYMCELARHFRRANNIADDAFPESYDAMEAYAAKWQQWNEDYTLGQTDFINALIDQYVVRNFPSAFRFIGRWTLLYTIRYEVLTHYRIKPLGGLKKFIARWCLKAFFSYKIYLAADAKTSFLKSQHHLNRKNLKSLARKSNLRIQTDSFFDPGISSPHYKKQPLSVLLLRLETARKLIQYFTNR